MSVRSFVLYLYIPADLLGLFLKWSEGLINKVRLFVLSAISSIKLVPQKGTEANIDYVQIAVYLTGG